MTGHRAACRCGQLSVTAIGEPVRISVCHCRDCQKRSGSAFAVQVRWPEDKVAVAGRSVSWSHDADSGNRLSHYFCPQCGSTVHYRNEGKADGLVAIPLGAFDDPYVFRPRFSVWERRRHDWVAIAGDEVEHLD